MVKLESWILELRKAIWLCDTGLICDLVFLLLVCHQCLSLADTPKSVDSYCFCYLMLEGFFRLFRFYLYIFGIMINQVSIIWCRSYLQHRQIVYHGMLSYIECQRSQEQLTAKLYHVLSLTSFCAIIPLLGVGWLGWQFSDFVFCCEDPWVHFLKYLLVFQGNSRVVK